MNPLRSLAVLLGLLGLLAGYASAAIDVGNLVWSDTDGDGVQDAGEPGIAGVAVQLWNSTKTNLLDATTTDSNGVYTLVASGPGNYRVRVVPPANVLGFSPENAASDTTDSDFNPAGADIGFTDIYTFSQFLIRTVSIDCGLLPDPMGANNVGDRVFRANASGTQTGTSGKSGVTVQLLSATGTVLQTTTSDSDGNYSFLASPGTYRLHFESPPGSLPSPLQDSGGDDANDSDIDKNGNTGTFTVPSSGKVRNMDAGFVGIVNVGNRVWSDWDADGIQDSQEPGIPETTVQIWNDSLTSLIGTTATDANGGYALQVPAGASYRVRVLPRYAGDRITLKNAGTEDTLDSDFNPSGTNPAGFTDALAFGLNLISITSVDVGIVEDPMKDHTIGDRVFRASAAGLQQETGNLSGVQVELYTSSGGLVGVTTSSATGNYSFDAEPGTYRLRFIALPGMVPSPNPNSGSDNNLDSDIDENGYTALFTLAPGAVRRDLDAGFVNLVNLGNLVWHDIDADGLQETGEEGVPDVELELWDADKARLFDTAMSNANGSYALKAPGPGTYRIWALRPMGTDAFSAMDAGGDNLVDSDVNPNGADFGFTDPITVGTNVISITSIDVGMTFPGSAATRTITPFRITGIQRNSLNWLINYQAPALGTYVLETSLDLTTWEAVGSIFATPTSSGTRSVALTPSVPAKHFRLRRIH